MSGVASHRPGNCIVARPIPCLAVLALAERVLERKKKKKNKSK